MVKDPDTMRIIASPVAATLTSVLAGATLFMALPPLALASPPAGATVEQEDTSTREDVNLSSSESVDSATGEHVDTPIGGGDPFYCGERKLGTWFYCERPKAKPSTPNAVTSAPSPTFRQQLDKIGARLEELKAKAVLEPTSDNIIAYVRYQREQLDRASTFADVWERAIWQHPDIDYTLQRPVSTLGKTAWLEQRKNDRDAVIASLSDRYGLFFFYSSSCGACEVFSPVVRSLSDKYHLSVLPVSMDGGPTRAFPRYVVNQGQYEKMGLEGGQVPALVLFDTYLKKPIPIGYGIMAEDEVLQRIFYLTSVKPGSDF
jgi:conjugal transfer pilus assembly protein TraF